MVDLIEKDNICGGVVAMDEENHVYPIRSQYVVLACGGIGGLYQNSTNYPHIAGDGLGIAMNHKLRWNIWITYRSIRRHSFPEVGEEDF